MSVLKGPVSLKKSSNLTMSFAKRYFCVLSINAVSNKFYQLAGASCVFVDFLEEVMLRQMFTTHKLGLNQFQGVFYQDWYGCARI